MNKMEKDANVIVELIAAIRKIEKAKHDTPNGLVDDHCANALKELFAALRMSIDDIQNDLNDLIKLEVE